MGIEERCSMKAPKIRGRIRFICSECNYVLKKIYNISLGGYVSNDSSLKNLIQVFRGRCPECGYKFRNDLDIRVF